MLTGGASRALSAFLVVLGVLLVVQTARQGVGVSLRIGYILGFGLVLAGAGRLWLGQRFGPGGSS